MARFWLALSVAVGGAFGSLARYGVSHAVPERDGIPVATLLENAVGAFLLGLLLESLLRAGPETPRRQWIRLTFGTGLLGGFTTYSALALDAHGLFDDGRAPAAFAYGVGSVVLGVLTCTLGVVVAAQLARVRHARSDEGRGS